MRTSRLWPDGHAAFELLQEDGAPVLSAKLGQELQVTNDLLNSKSQYLRTTLQVCEGKKQTHSEPLEHLDFPVLLCRRQPEAAAPVRVIVSRADQAIPDTEKDVPSAPFAVRDWTSRRAARSVVEKVDVGWRTEDRRVSSLACNECEESKRTVDL